VTGVAREESENRNGPMERLKGEIGELAGALTNRAVTSLLDRVEGTTGRLTDYVEGGAGPGLMAAVTGAKGLAEGKPPARSMLGAGLAGVKEKIAGLFRRGGKGGGKKLKLTNIVESTDVGVPVTLAYNQWTQYNDFPKFTKKVESVEKNRKEEQKVNWKAQVFWSHRTWEATIIEQVPDERIVWRSKGQKGHVDGAVTFHELGPSLTRILLVLEYHPQGMFERTGNLWRAQGRRARLELKHVGRHMMTQTVLHPDDAEGWRGTIHDGEVVESHEDALEREEQESPEQEESRQAGNGQVDDEARDRGEESSEESSEESGEESGPRRRAAKATTGEREDEEGEDEEGEGEEGEESGNGRATAARSRARSSSRSRSSSSRSSGDAGGGNGRRQRASATARRGGSK
jgi:Polyketide cyclase / dehydrase and lipid transport